LTRLPFVPSYRPAPHAPTRRRAALVVSIAAGLLAAPSSVALAAPLTITVTDAQTVAIVLECGKDIERAVVKNGIATFPAVPEGCTVDFVRRSGFVDKPGTWTCGLDGCSLDDIHHAPISDAAGRVNVVMTGEHDVLSLEVQCPSGYRTRVDLNENTAVFNSMPPEECTMLFKGGTPARFRPVAAGTYYCGLTGATAVCDKR
jgi:hypothetical protein